MIEEIKKKCEEYELTLDTDGRVLKTHPDKKELTLEDIPDVKTPEDFVRKFINELNNRYFTFVKGEDTIETSVARYRSSGDIFMITKNLFPEVKFFEILTILSKMEKNKECNYFHCPHIKKRVFPKIGLFDSTNFYLTYREESEYNISNEEMNELANL